jgi:hypothetical protein
MKILPLIGKSISKANAFVPVASQFGGQVLPKQQWNGAF